MTKWDYLILQRKYISISSMEELYAIGISADEVHTWLNCWCWLDLIKSGNKEGAAIGIENRLQLFGESGWECFNINHGEGLVTFYFKRPY